jgi:hypothetical protein
MSYDKAVKKANLTIDRALDHYSSRLDKMKTDQDVIKLVTDIIKNDLENNRSEVQETKVFLKSYGSGEIPQFHRKILCLALTCYIDDLEATKTTTRTKIGNLNIDFKEIDTEIESAQEIRKRTCPTDWHWESSK